VHRLRMALAEEPASGASQKEVNRQYVGPFSLPSALLLTMPRIELRRVALGRTKPPCAAPAAIMHRCAPAVIRQFIPSSRSSVFKRSIVMRWHA
jgi:hypothetical protein